MGLTPSLNITNPRTLNLKEVPTFFLKIKSSVVNKNSESNANQIAFISEKQNLGGNKSF